MARKYGNNNNNNNNTTTNNINTTNIINNANLANRRRHAEVDMMYDAETWASILSTVKSAIWPRTWEDWLQTGQQRKDAFQRKLQRWVDAHPAGTHDHHLAEKLASHIQFIPSGEFLGRFRKAVAWLGKVLAGKTYTVNYNTGKSDHWLSMSALNMLKNKTNLTYAGKYPDALAGIGGTGDLVNVAIFDDAMYSGQQIQATLRMMKQAAKKAGYKLCVYLVVPYASKWALSKVQNVFTNSPHKLHVFPGIKFFESTNRVMARLGIQHNSIESTLTIMDHKVPDAASFPPDLRLGKLINGAAIGRVQVELHYNAEYLGEVRDTKWKWRHVRRLAKLDGEGLPDAINTIVARMLADDDSVRPFTWVVDNSAHRAYGMW